MPVYAFAITTNKGCPYPGEISLANLHALFRELHVAFGTVKIRMHTRKPENDTIKLAYSSIALYLKEDPIVIPREATVESVIAHQLCEILQKHAPVYQGNSYTITPMEQYNGHAFVVHNPEDESQGHSHNEWFAMPLTADTPLQESDKCPDPPNQQYNRIIEYTPEHGFIKMYRGHNVNSCWLAYKNVSNGQTTYKTKMRVTGVEKDGIYDGIRDRFIPNDTTPDAGLEAVFDRLQAYTRDLQKTTADFCSAMAMPIPQATINWHAKHAELRFSEGCDIASPYSGPLPWGVPDSPSLRKKIHDNVRLLEIIMQQGLKDEFYCIGKVIEHEGHKVHLLYERAV